jgi:hypothetical protein
MYWKCSASHYTLLLLFLIFTHIMLVFTGFSQVISLWKFFVWCENFCWIFVPNYYSDLLFSAAVILAACDLNWRGNLQNAAVYMQFYVVTTLLELGRIRALRKHRFPWKTDSSWENYLLTCKRLASWARYFHYTSLNLFLWSILILSFSLYVTFLSCSLKKSCVLLLNISRYVYWRLILVGTCTDG